MTTYTGTDSSETFVGGAGSDTFIGRGGNDTLTGGGGNDVFVYDTREFGSDRITDFNAGDKLDLSFLKVADLASLAPFMTQDGFDTVITLGYDSSTEVIRLVDVNMNSLTAANFVFNTSATALNLTGTGFRDVLFGGNAADRIAGGNGSDTLVGGANNDLLTGGGGEDVLFGGAGNDIFIYNTREFGADTIRDFTVAGDRIDLSALNVADLASLQPFMSQDGADVVITLGFNSSTESIRLVDVNMNSLTAANFVFNTSATALNLTGTGFRDVLFGGNAADRLAGGNGSDTLVGGANNDLLTGGGGEDVLFGGAGNDTFIYNTREFGADTIRDFTIAGDKIDVSGLNVADLASLKPFMTQDGDDVVITLGFNSSTESIRLVDVNLNALTAANFVFNTSAVALNLTGTGFRDVLFGGNAADRLGGGNGSDTLVGGANNDQLTGGGGEDALFGGAGNDIFIYNTREFGGDTIKDFTVAGDRIDVSGLNVADLASLQPFMTQDGADVLITLGFNSSTESMRLAGVGLAQLTAANFVFNTSATALNLTGTGFRDTLFGGIGADKLSGGSGDDTLVGAAGNDTLTGGDGNDRLFGGAGADILNGGIGTDTASYATSSAGVTVGLAGAAGIGGDAQGDTLTAIETIVGSRFNDILTGDAGANVLTGGDGNDVLRGGAGADRIEGGAGTDSVQYSENTAGIGINLGTGVGIGGTAQGDIVTGIENAYGGSGNDALIGSGGNDGLVGGAGNDVLNGGGGADTLIGGAGADRFTYGSVGQSQVGAGADRITDFSHAQGDRIDLAAVDANSIVTGNQAFAFIGTTAFTHHAGEMRFAVSGGNTVVSGDVNGDGVADFNIVLTGAITLVAADFVL
ncbi:Ca2+-binding RTX toxin-like protein [Inquilinus ginsengisoli]|uniref:Ca2+-binding RTX toxin-like protein n=1 Tax=Inquilinus ginsengisoli TaxID=363840 RepID=A0ABU1JV27_9PROT|nr:M10 family metallopeptidase C-terminal domain-containing protein [Inquilinus ginsengisoli]MDR6292471.1 Ca2+-binding RTX toxin-like protein [Inquilinus ginsengisoli]